MELTEANQNIFSVIDIEDKEDFLTFSQELYAHISSYGDTPKEIDVVMFHFLPEEGEADTFFEEGFFYYLGNFVLKNYVYDKDFEGLDTDCYHELLDAYVNEEITESYYEYLDLFKGDILTSWKNVLGLCFLEENDTGGSYVNKMYKEVF